MSARVYSEVEGRSKRQNPETKGVPVELVGHHVLAAVVVGGPAQFNANVSTYTQRLVVI